MWLAGPDGTRLPAGVLALVRWMNRIALGNERSGAGTEVLDEPPAATRLGDPRAPLLVVVGGPDLADVRLATGLLAERVPGAELVTVDGAAHLSPLERPAEVTALVRCFLTRIDDPDG